MPIDNKIITLKLTTLKTFNNSIEAHILRSKLESENIRCFLFDENIVGVNPLYNVTVGGIKLKINEYDYARANEVLEEILEPPVMDEKSKTLRCPKCGSEQMYRILKSMKDAKGVLSAIISFLLLVFPIYFDTVYKCKKCDHEFS